MSGEKKTNNMNGPKSKLEATLSDPFGSIKITLWEQYTNLVQEGKTYALKNPKVRKNGDWHELTTARGGSTTITEVEPLKETYGLCPIQKVLDRFDVVVSMFIET